MSDIQSRNWAMTAHFSGAISSFFLPSLGWIGPGLVWLLSRDKPTVMNHAREAFQFQILMAICTWLIGLIGAGLSCFLFGPMFWFLGLIPWLASIGYGVAAGLAATRGESVDYPLGGTRLPALR